MLGQLGAEFTSRFTPIVDAIVLMWRAGPLLIGTFILLYTIVLAGDTTLSYLVTRVIGPQSRVDFWLVANDALTLCLALLIEPIRISVVAGAYDTSLGALRRHRMVEAATTPTGGQGSTENLMNEG